ncbi:uncharacterized protein TNCV_1313191 [Trichonephila clavipes]|nr:uncharacterized protein TNCV_1313191 [Trichonephila clavipes]
MGREDVPQSTKRSIEAERRRGKGKNAGRKAGRPKAVNQGGEISPKNPEIATAGSDVVQSGRPIFDDFFQHLWPYIGNNTANVVFRQAFVAYPHKPMTLHSPTENSLAVLNHKILEANSQVQNGKLGGHQTCLSINRLGHELCDMLHRLVGTTAPGHHDCSIQE